MDKKEKAIRELDKVLEKAKKEPKISIKKDLDKLRAKVEQREREIIKLIIRLESNGKL